MPFSDARVGDFVLKKQMSEDEYLDALENPPGVLVGGPSVTYTGSGAGYSYTQLFKTTSGGGTRHRRKRNKKTRKTRK